MHAQFPVRCALALIFAFGSLVRVATAQTSVVAWGSNTLGQCNVPPPPPGLSYVEIEGSPDVAMARLSDGSIVGWGLSLPMLNVPALAPGQTYVELAIGVNHAVARVSDGTVVVWGDNTYGEANVPPLPPGMSYVEIAAGGFHTVARRSDGAVLAWGWNAYGQCNVPPPQPGTSYVRIASHGLHTLALQSDGNIVAWGYNVQGQCNVPPPPAGLSYVDIGPGYFHTMGLLSDGSLVAWGRNDAGQCNVPPRPAGLRYVQAAGGFAHSLARLSDGTLVAFGDNSSGQCNVPLTPLSLANIDLACGYEFSLAMRDSVFTTFCYGDGSGIPCPCANNGAPGNGCANSASTGGAALSVTGFAYLNADSVQLGILGEPSGALGIVLQGSSAIAPANFGDGLRCVGGSLKRLFTGTAAGGAWIVPGPADPTLSQVSAQLGDVITAGSARCYQVYYRDLDASFCPAPQGGTFNVSSAMRVLWVD